MNSKLGSLVLCFVICVAFAHGQAVRMDPLKIDNDAFLNELSTFRKDNPTQPVAEFVAKANLLLDSHGLGYKIIFDANTCKKIRDVRATQKDPSIPIRLGTQIQSIGAEKAVLSLPSPNILPDQCGGCQITLPILQLNDSQFITRMNGLNIGFHRPSNFLTETAMLLDPIDQTKIKKTWSIPFRATPIGVSYDENVLYLEFQQPELVDLSLAVFGEGVFQITSRADAEEGGKGKVDMSTFPKSDELTARTIRFDRWQKSYTIKYLEPCKI